MAKHQPPRPEQWLPQLIGEAANWPEPGTRKPYWSARTAGHTSSAWMGLREVKRTFVQLIDQFEGHGYLVDAFGQDCVDADGPPPDPGPLSPAVWAMRPSGRPGGPGPAGRSTSSVIWSRCFMTWSRAPQAARITAIRAAAGTTTPLRPDALGGCTAGESTGCWPPAPLVCDSPRTARTLAGSFG